MLNFLSKIKNIVYNKLINKGILHKRRRSYDILSTSQRMFVNDSDDYSVESGSSEYNTNETEYTEKTEKTDNIKSTVLLFNTEIPKDRIENDYELHDCLELMRFSNIKIEKLVLEKKFEDSIRDITDVVVKTKMRLFYVIIANRLYTNIFEEKKLYTSDRIKHLTGVFRYNDYILRIDESPFSFLDEQEAVKRIKTDTTTECDADTSAGQQTDKYEHIILPFVSYINVRRKPNSINICDCQGIICPCIYEDTDIEAYGEDFGDDIDDETKKYSRFLFKTFRENMISFSIQHYVKNTQPLLYWVRENITCYTYNQFAGSQQTFYVELFYKCSVLLQKLHRLSIVHGDIKPDNILIKEDSDFNINHPERCKKFTVYLIDFGLSGIHGKGIGTGGTIPYCHPEFKNIRDTNKSRKYNWCSVKDKHDVWSLGLMFVTLFIYRDFYSYYYKYPSYFFNARGYVSALILDVIANDHLNILFNKILTDSCIPIDDVCEQLRIMMT